MANEKPVAATVAPPVMVIGTPQHSARVLAEEMAELKRSGKQFDKTVPGGRYIGTDGVAHDAHGKKLKGAKKPAAEEEDELPGVADLAEALEGKTDAEIRAMRARDERVTAQPIYGRALGEE